MVRSEPPTGEYPDKVNKHTLKKVLCELHHSYMLGCYGTFSLVPYTLAQGRKGYAH